MKHRLFTVFVSFSLAFLILLLSVFKASAVRYSFADSNPIPVNNPTAFVDVNYTLPEIKTTSMNILWPIIALNDKVETVLAADSHDKGLTLLKHSDARLAMGKKLYEQGNFNESLAAFDKAEKYLAKALEYLRSQDELSESDMLMLHQISLASLKHRELLEELLAVAPDEARAVIIKTLNTPKNIYKDTRVMLEQRGETAPPNPFEEQV